MVRTSLSTALYYKRAAIAIGRIVAPEVKIDKPAGYLEQVRVIADERFKCRRETVEILGCKGERERDKAAPGAENAVLDHMKLEQGACRWRAGDIACLLDLMPLLGMKAEDRPQSCRLNRCAVVRGNDVEAFS